MSDECELSLGALHSADGTTRFRVWAPAAERVEVHLLTPDERYVAMTPEGEGSAHHPLAGYFSVEIDGVAPGALYRYRLDGRDELADPASRHQPEGVDGPSAVVDRSFVWRAETWHGRPLDEYVVYELHVGAFTRRGTFDAAIEHLDELVELGVTAIELMPIAQFPGTRNWGYDGVFPLAVQSSYGGPGGLRRLVDACHQRGLAVVLDVVYNHLGPEGNVLPRFGPYFTDRYATPWGAALDFDGPGSEPVRRLFIESALAWLREYRIDALRCDAVHAIVDASERPFLAELAAAVHAHGERTGRRHHLFAESAVNTLAYLRPRSVGGCGFDAQWSDDFHHALHALLTGERSGYYADFGRLGQLARAYADGFAYQGEHSVFRRRRHGVDPTGIAAGRFVVCAQNHDQVGNRAGGERLTTLVSAAKVRLAAAVTILSPHLPLLFMGEEYGEEAPFLYFVDHRDPDLVAAVRRGRHEEFAHQLAGADELPDPAAAATFRRSRLDRSLLARPEKRALYDLYRELLDLARTVPALAGRTRDGLEVSADEATGVLTAHRRAPAPTAPGEPERSDLSEAFLACNFSDAGHEIPVPAGPSWRLALDSSDPRWSGARPSADPAANATYQADRRLHRLRIPPWSAALLVAPA